MTIPQKRIALHALIFLLAAYGSIASYGEHKDIMRLIGGFGIAYAFVFLGIALNELKYTRPGGTTEEASK